MPDPTHTPNDRHNSHVISYKEGLSLVGRYYLEKLEGNIDSDFQPDKPFAYTFPLSSIFELLHGFGTTFSFSFTYKGEEETITSDEISIDPENQSQKQSAFFEKVSQSSEIFSHIRIFHGIDKNRMPTLVIFPTDEVVIEPKIRLPIVGKNEELPKYFRISNEFNRDIAIDRAYRCPPICQNIAGKEQLEVDKKFLRKSGVEYQFQSNKELILKLLKTDISLKGIMETLGTESNKEGERKGERILQYIKTLYNEYYTLNIKEEKIEPELVFGILENSVNSPINDITPINRMVQHYSR